MLSQAAEIAASSKDIHKKYFLGSIALRGDGAYVYSTNYTVIEHRTPSSHAEARVLRKAGSGAVLWVARVCRNGDWGLARPCRNCQVLAENKAVKKVYYTIGPNEYGVWVPGNKSVSEHDKKRKICKCPEE